MGTIFVAGTYGVGKSTLCHKLSKSLNIPDYSAGDLISAINGEKYGRNKVVNNKGDNQKILYLQVKKLLQTNPKILLAGHFCIFDADGNVDCLPSNIFYDLDIDTLLLLEAPVAQIIKNLSIRDKKSYSEAQIFALQKAEMQKAREIAEQLKCSFYVHNMSFDEKDIFKCLSYIKGRNTI